MKCPICGNKIYSDDDACPYCKLRKSVIVNAKNADAKTALKNRQKDNVYLSTYRPSDVSKTKLLLLSIFLGWVGAHCYYVGRMARGFAILATMIIGIALAGIPETWALHQYVSGIVAGMFGFAWVMMWWLDILAIVGNRFKIPIVIDDANLNR